MTPAQLRDESRRAIATARNWLRHHGHAEILEMLYELLGSSRPEAWRDAGRLVVEIAVYVRDNPKDRLARALIAREAHMALAVVQEAVLRALELDRQACALMLAD